MPRTWRPRRPEAKHRSGGRRNPMSTTPSTAGRLEPSAAPAAAPPDDLILRKEAVGARWARGLSPRNIGAIYVWIAIIIIFTIVSPDVFPTAATAKSIVNQYAITGIV